MIYSTKFLSVMKAGTAITASAMLIWAANVATAKQFGDDCEHEAINYTKTTPSDPIQSLQKKIDSGQVKLAYNSKNGYLQGVLDALNIPVSSQILVFSKTSFQRDRIAPDRPRSLYFNEGSYIGWVQNGPVVEVSSVDPQLGATFYVLDQEKTEKPKFIRQTHECLQCHSSTMTSGVPGHIMRSVFPRADGNPDFRAGTFLTSDRSPIQERWGGWYVTGKHGTMRHMGNVLERGSEGAAWVDTEAGANITDLKKLVDTSPYITRTSDIVALMVIEHQSVIQNLITKANYQTRMALHYDAMLSKELGRPAGMLADSTYSRIRSVTEPLLKAMLFSGEAPLTSRIEGTSGYAEHFAKLGPKDKRGRSLRQFDLERRMFKYPLSYMIYSSEFDGLPDLAKAHFYKRLWLVLTQKDASEPFAHLSLTDRKAILEILLETKPEFTKFKEATNG